MAKPARNFSLYNLLVDTMVRNNFALLNKMVYFSILISNIKASRLLRSRYERLKAALPQKLLKSSEPSPQECSLDLKSSSPQESPLDLKSSSPQESPLDLTLNVPQTHPLDLSKRNKTKLVNKIFISKNCMI